MKKTILVLAFFSQILAAGMYAQPGTLDVSFDSDGKLITPMGSGNDAARGIAVQPDGKIVVAGYAFNGVNNDFALARYNTDGSLDNSFSSDGKQIISVDTSDNKAYGLVLQPDGKIIVAGTTGVGTNSDFALVRLNPDGNPDASFDGDGIVITSIGSSSDYATSIALQADGKIVVAGYSLASFYFKFSIARYNADGSLDISFSGDGKVITAIGGYFDVAYGVALQSDNKILVTGYSNNGSNEDFAMVRYNTDGTLDNSFDLDGIVTTSIGSTYEISYAVSVQSDGKIIAAGCTSNGTDDDFALTRYNTDGSLDNSFDIDGVVVTSLGADDWIFGMVLQPDGKILVAGYTQNGIIADFALVRYNTDGILDTSFDIDGIVTTDFGLDDDMAYGVALQPDLKIVAAGFSNNGSDKDFALARYISGLNIGITEFSTEHSVLIYPNPIEQEAILEYTLNNQDEISIELVDMKGKILKTFVGHQEQDQGLHKETIILPRGLASGYYNLILSSPKGKIVVKLFHLNE